MDGFRRTVRCLEKGETLSRPNDVSERAEGRALNGQRSRWKKPRRKTHISMGPWLWADPLPFSSSAKGIRPMEVAADVRLDEALSKIPASDRKLVEEKYWGGVRAVDIARSRGVRAAAVRLQCHRAIRKLRKALAAQPPPHVRRTSALGTENLPADRFKSSFSVVRWKSGSAQPDSHKQREDNHDCTNQPTDA